MAIEKLEKINGTCQLMNAVDNPIPFWQPLIETWVAHRQPYPFWISESLKSILWLGNAVLKLLWSHCRHQIFLVQQATINICIHISAANLEKVLQLT
jgi:hypothetical protein